MVNFKFGSPLTLSSLIILLVLFTFTLADFVPTVKQTIHDQIADGYAYFEDSSTIIGLRDEKLIISYNDGKDWKEVKIAKGNKVVTFSMDPFFKDRAFALTADLNQFVTNDQGTSWMSFQVLDPSKNAYDIDSTPKISYNSKNRNFLMFEFYSCPDDEDYFGDNCEHVHFVTKDGFKTNPSKLGNIKLSKCVFARGDKSQNDNVEIKDETILCTQNKLNSFGHVVESKLLSSNDFFNKDQTELAQDLSKTGSITDIRVLANFIVLVVRNDKFNRRSGVSFVVSKDGKNFDVSDLTIQVVYGEIQLLESSPLSIFVVVTDYKNSDEDFALSTIYASDSSGLRFTKRLDYVKGRSILKVQNIDGSWIALVASDPNKEKGEDSNGAKDIEENGEGSKRASIVDFFLGEGYDQDIRTLITIDDGKTWNPLKTDDCEGEEDCSLHILSPTERDGEGKFVTGPTPGILFGVGNVGKYVDQDVAKMHTWYSRDGGVSWNFALNEPCLFSFGDLGNIILAIPYYGDDYSLTDYYYYSLTQGKTWVKAVINHSIYPITLTQTTDGTSSQFLLTGLLDKTPDKPDDFEFSEVVYAIDFSKAFDSKVCQNSDYEEVYARLGQDGQPTCVYGHKEKFSRRKQDAQCSVSKLYEDVKIIEEPCKCTEQDYECNTLFVFNEESNKCVLDEKRVARLCSSQKKGHSFKTPDKVLIKGNSCKFESQSATDFSKSVSVKCEDYKDSDKSDEDGNKSGEILTTLTTFDGVISQYSYFEEGESFSGENVVVKLGNHIWASNDGGVKFVQVKLEEESIGYISGFVQGHVILLTNTAYFYVSTDGVNFLKKHKAPSAPNNLYPYISFHKNSTQNFIWYSSEDCPSRYSPDCDIIAYHTTNGGETFTELRKNVKQCDYVSPHLEIPHSDSNVTIFCSVSEPKSRSRKLISTTDYFKTETEHFDNIVGYAITGKYVAVATIDVATQSLRAKVTVDGVTFADAKFPKDIQVDIQKAYTVLDSVTKSIFLLVTTHNNDGREFGSILKSNSNGTLYITSLNYVNRNRKGYADYDRIEGLEGTIIANTVENYNDVIQKNDAKLLKTQISHNDGAQWNYLAPPAINSRGEKYSCLGSSLAKCSLNLHGFTERPDYRDTFSSSSATGLLIGVGSVGEYLEPYSKSSTFLSRDGGITWKEVKDGVYMWEYGDRGTILVLVDAKEETKEILYSLDEGDTWKAYEFTKDPVSVLDLATVPSDSSRKFIVFAKKSNDRQNTLSYSIDFSNVHQRQCELDLDNPDNNDYEYWTPKHPNLPDNCLFGHEVKYLRRAVGHNDCFIGSAPLKDGFKTVRNCPCTRRDFECDYNFYRAADETCHLVEGLTPADRQNEYCEAEGAFEYFESTGYRKIPLSTCQGGKKFASWDARPCPGKNSEFNKHYGREMSSGKWILVLGIPLLVFLFSVWFVYDRGIRRNGGFKRLGQIRLDLEDDDGLNPIEENEVDVIVNRIVRGGIYVVAAGIATFKTIRTIDRIMLDKIFAQIFRRSRSGHSRNYVQVPTDLEAEELFNDDYEEELDEDGIQINRTAFQDDIQSDIGVFGGNDDIIDFQDEDRDARDVDSRLFNIDDQSDDDQS